MHHPGGPPIRRSLGARTRQAHQQRVAIYVGNTRNAEQLIRSGRFADAAHWLDKAVSYRPDDVHAWYLLGMARYGLGQFSPAAVAFRRARQLRPANAGVYYREALAMVALGHVDKARRLLRAAIRLRPDFAEAVAYLAKLDLAAKP